MRKAIVTSLVALLLNSQSIFAQTRTAKDFTASFEAYIGKTLAKIPDIPAFAVIVIKDDRPIFVRAYGLSDREAGTKADQNTLFYIASGTKAFTALGAAMLDKEGKIKLAEPVTKYLTGIQFKNTIPDTITVRDLLTHTSGLRNDAVVNRLAFTGQNDPKDVARVFAIGTSVSEADLGRYRYTNFGYNFYGILLEHHLKMKWQDLVQQRVFNPAGLKHTTTYTSKARAKKQRIAAPYVFDSASGKTIRSVVEKNDSNMQSAGGMFMSISDIGRWLNVNMNDGRLDGKQVFPAELIRAAKTGYTISTRNDAPFPGNGEYGLGWQIGKYRDEKVIFHHGGFTGYSSHFSYLPDKKIAVGVVTNNEPVGQRTGHLLALYAYDWWLQRENLEAEYEKQLAGLVDTYEKRKQQSIASAAERSKRTWQLSRPFAEYAGKYTNELLGTMEIIARENALEVQLGNLKAIATPYTQKDSIRVEMLPGGTGDVIGFKEADGKIVSLNLSAMTFTKVAP